MHSDGHRRFELRGVVSSVGFASGDRFVIGHWISSPIGAFTDLMWATPDGVRHLRVPSAAPSRSCPGSTRSMPRR